MSANAWSSPVEEARSHKACRDGRCGQCRAGRRECECVGCGHIHDRDCEHCDGTGVCSVDGDALRAAARKAVREFTEFKIELTHPMTVTGFKQSWKAMFGGDAPDQAVDQWVDQVRRLASAAGEMVSL